MTLIDQIRDLIAEGETQRSLDELYKYVKESNADVIDNLVMLRSRMQNLQRAVHNGTMDDQAAALERAKINEAILKLLPQLTPEYLAEASKRKESIRHTVAATPSEAPAAPARDMKKLYLIGGGVLLVVVLLIAMLSGGGDSEEDLSQQYAADNSSQTYEEQHLQTKGGQDSQTGQEEDLSAEFRSSNGSTTFSTQDGTNWFEMENGEVKFRFRMTEETSEYVEIHDDSRQLTLRIFDNNVKFQQAGDSQWNTLTSGAWSN